MSFVVAAALAVGLLAVVPLIAHLLRRGRTPERVFPPAILVSKLEAHSRERSRLEDRALLSLRVLMVLVLALLGATPLVRWSRLSVDRPQGASVALALVIDDSHSMRASNAEGRTRYVAAIEGARQLMRSLREGDAVAIVLAGKPARLALSATTDLKAARAALEDLQQTDRASDLDNAVKLARSAIKNLEQPNRKLVVLSDLAATTLDAPDVTAPLGALRQPANDCGLVSARRQADRLNVLVACANSASTPRALRVLAGAAPEAILTSPTDLARISLEPRAGSRTLTFSLVAGAPDFELELTPGDDNPQNDRVHVSSAPTELDVGVVTDASVATVITGGPTIIEQALGALRPDVGVRPLSMLPDEARELSRFAALIVNDPAGLGPASRGALAEWIGAGGVALGLLGPASSSLQLSSTLEPFAERGARWEETARALDVDASSMAWLGLESQSLRALTRGGRMRLDGAALPNSATLGTWTDGVPFVVQRPLGSGLVITVGLPASVEHSDLALRPVFLALLDHLMAEAEHRRGPGVTLVGEPWAFPPEKRVSIVGPLGPLPLSTEGCDPAGALGGACVPGQQIAVPEVAGRYQLNIGGATQSRIARIDEHEITDAPGDVQANAAAPSSDGEGGSIDASPELALLLLAIFAAELALRLAGEAQRRRRAVRAAA